MQTELEDTSEEKPGKNPIAQGKRRVCQSLVSGEVKLEPESDLLDPQRKHRQSKG